MAQLNFFNINSFKKPRKKSLCDQIYHILKNEIIIGKLKPGQRLIERQLVDALGCSKTPIRESIRALIAEGFLQSNSKGRVTVYNPNIIDIAEIFTCRAYLESLAAAVTAMRIKKEDIKKLENIIDNSEKTLDKKDAKLISEYNTKFHNIIIYLSGSISLKNMLENLSGRMPLFRIASMGYPMHAEFAVKGHREIIHTLRQKDSERAAYIVKKHILEASYRLIQAYGGKLEEYNPIVEYIMKNWCPSDISTNL